MFQYISWVHISLMTPHKIVQLVGQANAVSTPAHEIDYLGRAIILKRPKALLPISILDGVAEKEFKKWVAEGAERPSLVDTWNLMKLPVDNTSACSKNMGLR